MDGRRCVRVEEEEDEEIGKIQSRSSMTGSVTLSAILGYNLDMVEFPPPTTLKNHGTVRDGMGAASQIAEIGK